MSNLLSLRTSASATKAETHPAESDSTVLMTTRCCWLSVARAPLKDGQNIQRNLHGGGGGVLRSESCQDTAAVHTENEVNLSPSVIKRNLQCTDHGKEVRIVIAPVQGASNDRILRDLRTIVFL